ncbi:hypothetical protein FNB15_05470 [Ferrovibrio terrae]|uniref:Uncharacterized protein n=1 Tax=Ferrovibrio terrae TaxID=2594003 RepID=A0A516GZ01_9PROT|nr:hypothetical protein [Ferrovibrio terrae]QDO96761.1 hypothetical protein FNB15_05470 [Ferrovibrio terrae]
MSKPKLSKPAQKAPGKPGLLARLFGAEQPAAPKPAQKYTGPAKTDSRDPRILLAQQIRAIRAKLNPQILRLAEKVAKKGPPTTDQDRATLAIEIFLAQKEDGGDFATRLKARLDDRKRNSH